MSSGVGGFGPGPVPTSGDPRGTVLYDAVFLAADEKLRSEVGRKVIVLITDGGDEGSRKKIEDAIEAAQKADAVVYSIDYSDPRAYGNYGPFGGFGGGAQCTRRARVRRQHRRSSDRRTYRLLKEPAVSHLSPNEEG